MRPLVQTTFAPPGPELPAADEPLFVHRRAGREGLGGSRYGEGATWGDFPRLLFEDLPQVDVGLYGYRTLLWRVPSDSLLDIALDHLSLGRAHLGLALTAPSAPANFRPAAEHLDRAVDGLRQAGVDEFIARGLLARAALRRLVSDFPAAESDLREAEEIAERGSMRLHEADAHLEWTRLRLATGDPAAARRHVARARDLVRACGYGRREREVAWLERQLSGG